MRSLPFYALCRPDVGFVNDVFSVNTDYVRFLLGIEFLLDNGNNFAENGGFLGKRKSLKCFIFRDLPNLKSFKSGATRNRDLFPRS